MNARTQQLLDEVLSLPTEERDAFAALLLEQMDAPPDARDAESWAAELERRAVEVARAEWRGRSWAEVRAEVAESLGADRDR